MKEILNIVLGDASDADINLVYEKNVYNTVSNWDNETLFLLYLRNLLLPLVLIKILLAMFLKLYYFLNMVEVMFLFKVLLLIYLYIVLFIIFVMEVMRERNTM